MYTKESLDTLRSKIDLTEVLQSHLKMQRSGAAYKALCPFHQEKTASFIVRRGDTHYHCFGCGAHGDAIAFLMEYHKMSFADSVASLAERFGVILEEEKRQEEARGPSKAELKAVLEEASRFYHHVLVANDEGKEPASYLAARGIDRPFIDKFQLGYAPKGYDRLVHFLQKKGFSSEILQASGLMTPKMRDFFSERITFPIYDAMQAVIGFSARKWREETFGGKYINTPETPLFKKSQVLFGLSECRRRIAKERRAIIVEGQIDALRLIDAGLNVTVAGLGTAFGEGHVRELLHLGVRHVFLAMDGDLAGRSAACKIGDLFQMKGVEVSVLSLPKELDPDSFVRTKGIDAFVAALKSSTPYLNFLFTTWAEGIDLSSPSLKNDLVERIAGVIRSWEQPVMVHESLRKLAQLTNVPEELLGIKGHLIARKAPKTTPTALDADRILEVDLLRWLVRCSDHFIELQSLAARNMAPESFLSPSCQALYRHLLEQKGPQDLLSFGSLFDEVDPQLLPEIMQKKINLQKAREGMHETLQKLLVRSWMQEREQLKEELKSLSANDEKAHLLIKKFDELNKTPPKVQ